MTDSYWFRPIFSRLLLLVLAISSAAGPTLAQLPPVRIALLFDGPSERNKPLRDSFKNEISVILEGEFQGDFFEFEADWTGAGISQIIDRALSDSSIDIVVALGQLSSSDLVRRQDLPKPVFAPFVIAAELLGAPSVIREYQLPPPERPERVRVSGVTNLNYLTLGIDPRNEIKAFQEVTPFSKLTIISIESIVVSDSVLAANSQRVLAALNLEEIKHVAAVDAVDATLSAIPDDTEAVYLSALPIYSSAQLDSLVEGLNKRKLPTFSIVGRALVERGVMAGLGGGDQLLTRARRVAINIQEVLTGTPAGEISVDYVREEQLSINMATVRRINASPRYVTLLEADILNPDIENAPRTLSLSAVVRAASTVNLDLAAADRLVAAGLELVGEAKGGLLPQIEAFASANFLDETSGALLGRNIYAGGVGVTQLLYSDDVWANYSIEKSLQDAREEARSELRLDVIQEAADSYLNLLRADSTYDIELDNLNVTRTNLEIAASRVEIGVAGREEVFRWESQIATNQLAVIEAVALRTQARLAVNRVLNRDLDEEFLTTEATLGDPEMVSSFDGIGSYVEGPRAFEIFSDFMASEAVAASPELKQFESETRARERAVTAAKRELFIPDVSLSADLSWIDSSAADPVFGGGRSGSTWGLQVGANLPIWSGGERYARLSRVKEELRAIVLQKEAAEQRVEERIRSILQQTSASFIGIGLSRRASAAAQQNLDLVSDSYAEGVVGITVLLDAQNQALVARLAAAEAVFNYLIDLMGVQRAVGRFDYYRSAQDRQEFLNRANEFFQSAGFPVRTP